MQQSILTINAGSSSVKFALFELAEHIAEKAAISGQIDGIGTAHVRLVAKDNTGTRIVDQALPAGADHAVSLVAAKTKGITSNVAGRADILVTPDLVSGNMLAKQLEYMANALAAAIVIGAKVPIVLTSRADTAETRMASCVIASLVAHHNRGKVQES